MNSSLLPGVCQVRVRDQSLPFDDQQLSRDENTCTHRCLPQGCQVEQEFDEEEWPAFIKCARRVWKSGDFRHRELEEKLSDHNVREADVRNAIWKGAYLVAYRDKGMERVTLYDRDRGKGLVVVCTLKDGIITAYRATNFEQSLRTKTNIRWLRRLT